MMDCCEVTYLKYIKKNSEIDYEVLNREILKLESQPDELWRAKLLRERIEKQDLCMCPCHVVGSVIIH